VIWTFQVSSMIFRGSTLLLHKTSLNCRCRWTNWGLGPSGAGDRRPWQWSERRAVIWWFCDSSQARCCSQVKTNWHLRVTCCGTSKGYMNVTLMTIRSAHPDF